MADYVESLRGFAERAREFVAKSFDDPTRRTAEPTTQIYTIERTEIGVFVRSQSSNRWYFRPGESPIDWYELAPPGSKGKDKQIRNPDEIEYLNLLVADACATQQSENAAPPESY